MSIILRNKILVRLTAQRRVPEGPWLKVSTGIARLELIFARRKAVMHLLAFNPTPCEEYMIPKEGQVRSCCGGKVAAAQKGKRSDAVSGRRGYTFFETQSGCGGDRLMP